MDKTAFGVHNGAPDEIKLMHYDWLSHRIKPY